MKKWLILFIVIILGGLIFVSWQEEKKVNEMVQILDRIHSIDLIIVKDGKSREELLNFTSSDSSFSKMADIYHMPYYDLKWSERKLLNEEPYIVIEYLKDNSIQYKVIIYQLNEKHNSMLTNENHLSEYIYSPEEENNSYIFAIKETDQLIGVNQELKELLNTVKNH